MSEASIRAAGGPLAWVAALALVSVVCVAPACAGDQGAAQAHVEGAKLVAPESAATSASAAAPAPSALADSVTTPSPARLPARDYIAEVRAGFTPENHAYATRHLWVEILDPLYAIAVGMFLLFSGLAARMRDVADNMGKHRYVRVLVFFSLYVVISWVLTFPLSWYSGFALEHQFGLSTQSFGRWIADEFKGQAVIILFLGGFGLLSLAYGTIEKSPRRWWLSFAIATLPIIIFLVLIEPIVIDPIFNKFTPLRDAELRTEILDLAAKAGIPGRNVYEVDQSTKTRKFDAYVNGFGASQRIVIWDTTLHGMTHDEILYVVGHEMGHYVLGHVWKGVLAISLAAFLLFWLASVLMSAAISVWGPRWKISAPHDIASIPLLAVTLTVLSLVTQPIANAYSRRVEHEADLFGLEVTHLSDAGARAFLKIGSQNRSDPEPNTFVRLMFYTHPPLLDRVRTARDYHPWLEGKPNKYFKVR
jgi:STE24 endopeptidase